MLALSATLAMAQSSGPYAAYVFPAGGQRGTTFTATVAGQNLGNPLGAEVSGEGASVRVLGSIGKAGPLTKVQEVELRRRLQELTRSGPGTAAGSAVPASTENVELPDLQELRNLESRTKAQLRLVFDQFLNRDKRPKPPMDELVTLEITLAASAASGDRALRLRTRNGLTNPLVFQVGAAPENREPGRFEEAPAEPPLLVLPSVLNGQIFPGEVDRFRLDLSTGEAVDLSAEARSLIPYLADAVPGWFQAVLSVFGPDGDEVAYCDDDGLDPDPRLSFRAPTDGVYTITIRDSIYRGREDFVYRLRISAGSDGPAAPAAAPPDAIAGRRSAVVSVPFPSKVRGVLAKPGSIDAYEFTAQAGETVVADVRARRDGSPLDSFLRLRDAAGKIIASNDDAEDKECGLLTAHADSYIRVNLPAAGIYRLELLDTTGKGGEAYAYTLDIRRPAPDFAVLTTLSALNLGPAGSAAFSVVVVRRDGWQGDITLRLRRPERGFSLEGGLIPSGREKVQMTLTGRNRGSEEAVRVELEAAALIGGVEVVHPVKPADLRMQAFGNTHLVPAEALWVSTRRGKAAELTPSPSPPLVLAPGGSVGLTFRHPPLPVKSLRVELVNPPAGITLKDQKASTGSLVLVFSADQSVKEGTENLVLSLKGEPADPQARAREVDLGVLPAIVVNIIAKVP
ncbi:MAG: PPC domain-containing protein [Spirochaetes bacterium]|nr:PPC domain-containing protein [Spirochaetota bacterium]